MMQEEKYILRMQWLVLTGAALLILLLLGAWISDGKRREWKKYQEDGERGIYQVELLPLNRVDRCMTCHTGVEDPNRSGDPQPRSLHPGTYLADHPPEDFGCSICHGGQGRALTVRDAHAKDPGSNWPFPLLEQPYIQASCGKCHLRIFSRDGGEPTTPEAAGAGMEVFLRGRAVFSSEGCLGCHRARGVGGIIGPDLTQQGEKSRHEYSFRNVQGEQSISNWLKEHFRDPEMVSPGSRMLRVNLEEGELDALATFVMGLAKPDISLDYFSLATLNEFKGSRELMTGAQGFDYLCSACHGKEGEGKSYTEYQTGIPAIGSVDFRRVASEAFIRFTLEKGRSLRQMGSWNGQVSGLRPEELDRIAAFLKDSQDQRLAGLTGRTGGTAAEGRLLFDRYCTTCHGPGGKGGVAVALNQPGFLDHAGERFILATLLKGRRNTAMPAWFQLEDRELESLVVYIRSWADRPAAPAAVTLLGTDPAEGALTFHYLCSRCHGEWGEGDTGPAIINPDFLDAADDLFLLGTIAGGREHTAMFGWSQQVVNQEKLGDHEIGNIIAFMREEAKAPLNYIHAGANPGDRERGRELFRLRCAECHGPSGEGVKGPALNNQELLSAASNGYLLATITLGRKGTAMPSWGYGDEINPSLTGAERRDLVAYIRSWQRIRIRF